jgi:hypothetical protein
MRYAIGVERHTSRGELFLCGSRRAGYRLYYPSRRQPAVSLALLVDALRRRG